MGNASERESSLVLKDLCLLFEHQIKSLVWKDLRFLFENQIKMNQINHYGKRNERNEDEIKRETSEG